MANVVKKHSISFELAQKMVAEALAKAKEIGVTENVAILDDGGNLKTFARMDGAPILCIEMAQNKAHTALFRRLHAGLFQLHPGRPVTFGRHPHAGACGGAIGLIGAPTVQNDVDCAKAALALVVDGSAE